MDINNRVTAIVVQDKSAISKTDISTHEHKLWGKTSYEWVCDALVGIDIRRIVLTEKENLIPLIKNEVINTEFTIVLFSDSPLLTVGTIHEIIGELADSDEVGIRLTRGVAYRTEFLDEIESFTSLNYFTFDEEDFLPVTNYKQLSLVSEILKRRILDFHMTNNVYIVDPSTTFIDSDVKIGAGTTIQAGNHLSSGCLIGSNALLKPNNMLSNAVIESGAVIWASTIEDSKVGKDTSVGPYAYIRNKSVIGEGCRIGDYVEVKKSIIGNGTKMAHLTYVGDAEIGEKCNLGCGVVFANYDGKNKAKTVIGNRVFVGSNCNLVAPLMIEDNSFIAAGTTVTENIDKGKLVIGRVRQSQKDYKHNFLDEDKN